MRLFPLALILLLAPCAQAQNFATQVVDYANLGSAPYGDPTAALGQPTTLINGGTYTSPVTYHASMVYGPYNTDPNNKPLIDVTGDSGYVTVKFDTPITHDSRHWYGDDFIVFGNPFFSGSQNVTPTTDMTTDIIASGQYALYQNGEPAVSVSTDGSPGSFIPLTHMGAFFPTNPYSWAGVSAANPSGWDDSHLHDFTKPINPNLAPADFGGKTVAYAANTLYDNSAGGVDYTLAGLIDPATHLAVSSISYIRFSGPPDSLGSNVVDGVSRVSIDPASAPEPGPLCVLGMGLLGLTLLRAKSLSPLKGHAS